MKSKKTIKKILIFLVVAIALLALYSLIAPSQENPAGSLTSLLGSSGVGQLQENKSVLANAEILRILGSIQNIQLDDSIFDNPVFFALEDNNFRISTPTNPGRQNPFLPIGYDAISNFLDQTQDTQVPDVSDFFQDA